MEEEKVVRPAAWRNSNLGPKQARRQGKCGACGGRKRFAQTINGQQTFVVCSTCNGTGKN